MSSRDETYAATSIHTDSTTSQSVVDGAVSDVRNGSWHFCSRSRKTGQLTELKPQPISVSGEALGTSYRCTRATSTQAFASTTPTRDRREMVAPADPSKGDVAATGIHAVGGVKAANGGAAPACKPRERWASRWTFIIASVGSAIGLGNVWRFPYLMYKHGGGTFLIPYVIFLLCTGLPLLQTELALGRLFQKGDIESFGSIHKRCRGVGSISVVGGFGVVTYYSAIIAWAAYFFGASFKWPFPWAISDCGGDATCLADPDQALPLPTSNSYFTDTVLQSNDDSLTDGVARIFSGPLVGCLLFTWMCCYFCIWKGVQSVGIAAKITVFTPWLLLAIFIIYNATLEGSIDGIEAYIGNWDMSALKVGSIWSDAAGQIFFTLGATLGIMSAYGSFAPATTNVWADNNYICYINCFTSFMAGFAIFSILGNMAWRQREIVDGSADLRLNFCNQNVLDLPACRLDNGMDCSTCIVDDWKNVANSICCGNFETGSVAQGGVMLAFSVYPASLQFLSKGGANILSIMWFGMLFLLGIDSMFAMVEGVSTVITDTPRFRHLRKEAVAAVACVIGFIGSLAFASDIGLPLLDIFDHYIINYGLFVTGALEAFTVSWIWGWAETKQKLGYMSAALLTYGFMAACALGVGIAGALHYEVETGVNIGIGFAIGFAIFASCTAAAFVTRSDSNMTFQEWINVWVFAGTRNLRKTFQINPSETDTLIHVITFDVPIKYICPPALLGLFVNQAVFDATAYDNGYENYPNWLQSVAGILVLGTMFGSLILFAVYPDFWDVLGVDEEAGKQIATYEPAAKKDVEGGPGQAMFEMPEDDGWGK
eukprot:jgi/Ulvmu1/6738/UM030_0073.1